MTDENADICIGGLQKSSLIDYPGKISAIIFTQGCNFACPYCHNPELGANEISTSYQAASIIEFLHSRKGKLDAVVITGGEPTLHTGLPEFIKKIKNLGFLVKLDTNGTNPKMLEQLISEKLIDYVAMDIKAPIEKYSDIVCSKVKTDNILKCIEILKNSKVDYEFRTTVVKSQLSRSDFFKIAALIQDAPRYYLQRFFPTKTLDESFLNEQTYSDEEFEEIKCCFKNVGQVELR